MKNCLHFQSRTFSREKIQDIICVLKCKQRMQFVFEPIIRSILKLCAVSFVFWEVRLYVTMSLLKLFVTMPCHRVSAPNSFLKSA